MIINDFNQLSKQEQIDFAKRLVDRINTKHAFGNITLVLDDKYYRYVDANTFDGTLGFIVDIPDIQLTDVAGSWSYADQHDDHDMETDAPNIYTVATEDSLWQHFLKEYFIDDTIEFEGYNIEMSYSDFLDSVEVTDFTIDDYEIDNDGIGSYEYWGMSGYDAGYDYISYAEGKLMVEGTLCAWLSVSPKTN